MDTLYTDSEISQLVSKLNHLMPEYSQWRAVTARVPHIDIFGNLIAVREIYYARPAAAAYAEIDKLSIRSMARLVFCLESDNPVFHAVTARLHEIKGQQSSDDMEKLIDRLG